MIRTATNEKKNFEPLLKIDLLKLWKITPVAESKVAYKLVEKFTELA